jgi:putative ABC transport system permease protein
MKRFLRRLISLFTRRRDDAELAREMASHVTLLEDEHRRRGLDPEAAKLAARQAMGSIALAKDRHRDTRTFPWIEDARIDLRVACRMLVAAPGFVAVVVLTMALSVGATTTLFSLVYGVLMRPLPWPDADRIVRVQETRGGRAGRVSWTISNGTYRAWREQSSTVGEIGGWFVSRPMTMTVGGEPDRVMVGAVTPSLLRVLGARPHLGRLFADADARLPAEVVILGFDVWQSRFGGRADIVGQAVRLDDRSLTVIAVMPDDFVFPNRETVMWTPAGVTPVQGQDGVIRLMIFSVMARLRPGVTPAQAAAEATARARSAPDPKQAALALFGGGGEPVVTAAPARDVLTAEVRPGLLLLLAAIGLLFIAATASVIVLHLSRVSSRAREMAVRAAIGAGSGRLLRQWFVESGLLGGLGGLSGALIAVLLHRGLPAVLPAGFPRVDDVRLDWRVMLFAAATTMAVSIACGVVPSLARRRMHLAQTLTVDGTGATPATARTPAARARMAIMAGQVAVACVLLVGATLLLRSFTALLEADRGFDPRGVLTLRLPLAGTSTFAKRLDTIERIQARLRALPGVRDVAFGNALPFVTPGLFRGMDMTVSSDPATTLAVQTIMRAVSPEYFATMRLRVVDGRPLRAEDSAGSPPVVVVNRTFARQYLGDRPLGQRLQFHINERRNWEVVGVVDDMRQGTLESQPGLSFGGVADPRQPEMFFVPAQWDSPIATLLFVVRTNGDPASLASAARSIIRDEEPAQPVDSIMTMEERLVESLAGPRTYAIFLSGFALSALAIAGVGLFGVLSYTTSLRTREIGLRTALGARRRDVIGLVVRQAVAITAAGLVVGVSAALALSQSLSTLLYGVSARDTFSFVAVPLLLIVVAVMSCLAPAWRATRIDPIMALRAS